MRIITVSRQFGSGGRELGKRLAQVLDWDYYDKEIIGMLADEHDMDVDAVRKALATHGWHDVQLTYRNSFSYLGVNHGMRTRTQLMVRQSEIIREIAEAGNDCVIVGRDADVILHERYGGQMLRLFVCADMEARLARTMAYEERRPEGERLSEREIRRNILRIDKNRRRSREILTGRESADASSFDLMINAGGRDLKALSQMLAEFSLRWFDQSAGTVPFD